MGDDLKPRTTYALFYQDKWWKDIGGTWHELATMDARHRANLLPFMRRRIRAYHDDAHRDASRLFYDAPNNLYEQAMAELERDPVEWFESTPLVAALHRYEEQATVVDRLRTWSHNRTYKVRKRMGIARS